MKKWFLPFTTTSLIAVLLAVALTLGTGQGARAAVTTSTYSPASCVTVNPSHPTVTAGQVLNVDLTFTCLPGYPDQPPFMLRVDWGDQTPPDLYVLCESDCIIGLQPDVQISHTYNRAGTYPVDLDVETRTTHYNSPGVFTVHVAAPAPTYAINSCLTITPTQQSVSVGASASLSVKVACVPAHDAPPINLEVWWGDGNLDLYTICFANFDCNNFTSKTITASHTYKAAGTYSVNLTVQDNSYSYRDSTAPVIFAH